MYLYTYVYFIYKCHNETPCITIINKQKCLSKNMKFKKIKQILSGGWYQWEGGGHE
jgi:hypothetical protein